MNNNQPILPDDEFDVEAFAKKLYRIFLKGIQKLLFPVRVVFSKSKVLSAFIFSAILVSVLLKLMLPPVYKSSFILRPQNRADLYFINLVNDIHILVKEDDIEGVMRELKIDNKTAKSLVKIGVDPIRKNKFSDTVDALEIFIYTKDLSIFDTIQNSIMQYMENSPYYLKLKTVHQEEISQMEKKLALDMDEIDSIKRLLAQNIQPRGNGGFVYGEPTDPVRVYEEGMNLFRQQMNIIWQKQYTNNFELVKPCVVSKKPASPRFTKLLVICLGISVLLCFFYNYRKL
jgi:hypothetical protein